MASQTEEDLTCPICHDIFKEPVVLSCSHSFCRSCLKNWWEEKKTPECPDCKETLLIVEPPVSLTLKNLCETFVLERKKKLSTESEPLCNLHAEKLKLFCLDHHQPACLVCRDSKLHINHRFRPIHEFAHEHKGKLQKLLEPVQEKLKIFREVKGNFDETAEHIKVQAEHTERKIKEQFKKLHQFLQEEEEARIKALREEEEQKSQIMKVNIDALSIEIIALSDTIRVTEKELKAEDVSFLLNYKAAVERVQQRPLMDDPQLDSGALIDVAKHLGNLSYNIWDKMKEKVSYSPVILDPNTAHPDLILCEDLTSVRLHSKIKLPENPERMMFFPSVLGSEGFDSGSHSWDVEVGNNTHWRVGVAAESIDRKGLPQSGFLRLLFFQNEYTTRSSPDRAAVVTMKTKLKKVRVHLDWDRGTLSFSDPDTNTHIHTITHTFTEKMFPYFSNGGSLPLKTQPVKETPERKGDWKSRWLFNESVI
ncbi:nuclear factor 7, ovary-like [Mugil cephalus]|uniref:nuclear factor 7, ovary-like n=1 Tax=Mugil cephalus TaxID=48193 RepID=UPI001FB76153|nr:nuclear factor 7, ovary-like [Mugil cephalus]